MSLSRNIVIVKQSGPETLRQQRPALTTTRKDRAMATSDLPTPIELRKLLSYNPETGKLTWLPRPREMFQRSRLHGTWNTRFAGTEAFTAADGHGYLHGTIRGVKAKAHRVAYALYHGEWPEREVDHINGDRTDNRIANLRSVSRQANLQNMAKRRDNTTGVTGVYHQPRCTRRKWSARIGRRSLGSFETFDAACAARRAAEVEHGFHPNHGRSA